MNGYSEYCNNVYNEFCNYVYDIPDFEGLKTRKLCVKVENMIYGCADLTVDQKDELLTSIAYKYRSAYKYID